MIGIDMCHQWITRAVNSLADDASILFLSFSMLVGNVTFEGCFAAKYFATQLTGKQLLRWWCIQRIQSQPWHGGEHWNTTMHLMHSPRSTNLPTIPSLTHIFFFFSLSFRYYLFFFSNLYHIIYQLLYLFSLFLYINLLLALPASLPVARPFFYTLFF